MTVEGLYLQIVEQKTPLIYVSGKTSTGKSTFGRRLRDELGYQVIELEAVLLGVIKEHSLDEQTTFHKVLYEAGDFKEKALFFEATDRVIFEALSAGRPLVIEGAVSNVETLQRVLQPAPDLLFAYFHPTSLEVYIRNLTSRFMSSGPDSNGGLPLKFWQFIDTEEFKQFCKTRELSPGLKDSIAQYAQFSQQKSLSRLEEFRQKFDEIIVVEIL